jgi:hypothetical protein
LLRRSNVLILSLRVGKPAHKDGDLTTQSTYKEMQMKNYDYDEIEAYIAKARRLRSEAMGEYLARAWQALKRGVHVLATAGKAREKGRGRNVPCLPA